MTPNRPELARGRPKDRSKEYAFFKVAAFLQENDDEQVTIGDLVLKMREYCEDPYSTKYMKKKLRNHFGNDLLITNINGKPDVATFWNTAADIFDKFYQTPKETDPEAERMRVIQTAAHLIRNNINYVSTSPEEYPK